MGQQISIEDAFPVYQKRCGELFEETLLLRAQAAGLERQLAAVEKENALLKQASPPDLAAFGPDLAAQPPYTDERD